MQPISSDALSDLLSGHKVDIRISCEGIDSSIVILDEDIIDGSFSIDRNSVSGEVIEIGNAETTEVKFSLNNVDHRFDSFKFEGAVLTIDLYISSQQIRLGKFIVDKRPGKRNAISIIALDYMAKFNKPYYTSLTDGATLFEMLQDCCASCNVTLYEDSITNGSVPCLIPTEETTFHEVVSLIAELSGSNAWIDWNGELRLSWYGENQSSVLNITDEIRYSYSAAENDILITGILYKSDEEYLAGTDEYALVMEENPLVDIVNISTILSSIYAKVGGFIYRPFSLSSSGLPHLWPMDAVDLTTDSTFRSYITNHKYTLNGLSDIQAKGESESNYSYASAAPFTARQKSVLNKVIDIRAGQQITALDEAMIQINELAANAQGFYQTTVTDPVTSARIDYMHNQPLLSNSTIVYKRTADGFFWTDNYQGGSTVWTSGYTASGNIVAKTLSVVGINADWISTGSITGTKLADGTISDVKVATGLSATKITTGSLTSSNFSGTGDGSAFSTSGTKINMNDGTIASKTFRIDSVGNAVFAGAMSGGTININSGRFDVNSSGDVYARYLRIGADGCDVEGDAYFDDGLHVDGSLSSRYYDGDINSIGTDKCGTSSFPWNEVWAYDTSINSPSDRRLKKDIVPIKNGVELILNLNPIQYKWNEGTRDHYGLIAQEVKETMTKVGIEDAGIFLDTSIDGMQDGKEPFYGLRYGEFISPMVQTIQHLEQRIKELESRLGG